ncbi:MAG: hypothetical protein ACP5FL_00445 [Thermoplasmatota archaeon]
MPAVNVTIEKIPINGAHAKEKIELEVTPEHAAFLKELTSDAWCTSDTHIYRLSIDDGTPPTAPSIRCLYHNLLPQ